MSILLVILSLLPTLIYAHVDGAGACFDNPNDMVEFLSNHQQPICNPTASQFGLYTTPLTVSNTLVAGCKYTVSLCGPKPFEGFLLYAQSPTMSPSRIGSWFSPMSTPSKLMSCSGSKTGTITHINSAKKMRADFTFITPSYDVNSSRNATVTINARIVVQLTEWYTTSLSLNYLNIDNQHGAMCPDPVSLTLTTCPIEGIIDTTKCPAPGTTVDPMAGMDMGDGHDGHNHNMGNTPTTTPGGMDNMNNMGHDHNMNGMDMSGGHSMSTIFSTNWSGIQLVFPGFTLNNTGAFVGALIVCFFVAFGLELIQWIQHHHDKKLLKSRDITSSKSESKLDLEEEFRSASIFTPSQQMSRSLLHTIRIFLSLFLMMIWMTLNVGLVLAALGGSFIGFYIFQQYTRETTNQAGCHV